MSDPEKQSNSEDLPKSPPNQEVTSTPDSKPKDQNKLDNSEPPSTPPSTPSVPIPIVPFPPPNSTPELPIDKEWALSKNSPSTQFKPIDPSIIQKILDESVDISPFVREMFEEIYRHCVDKFNFLSNKIPLKKYQEFYSEVNRLVPSLKKKIIIEDCFSTVFFIGDSHGSIEDTFYTIDFLYQILQKDSKVKFIFVGDYVDRNPFDLENLTLIVAFALLCPQNVVLIRGNHEDRTINTHYGFLDNLLRSFWEEGEELYNLIITYFIHLPLAHIAQMHNNENNLTARVLTTHGGIPIDALNFMQPILLNDLEDKLICEKERSEEMDMLSVSMLWSDPDEMIQGIINDGSSGRMRFGFPVFDVFMKANNIHLLIRGHQKWNEGFKIFFGGQLYSLFSTSKYDNRKKFNPKILHLELGKSPKLLDIEPDLLAQEAEFYPVRH
jgi:hypothetical protein